MGAEASIRGSCVGFLDSARREGRSLCLVSRTGRRPRSRRAVGVGDVAGKRGAPSPELSRHTTAVTSTGCWRTGRPTPWWTGPTLAGSMRVSSGAQRDPGVFAAFHRVVRERPNRARRSSGRDRRRPRDRGKRHIFWRTRRHRSSGSKHLVGRRSGTGNRPRSPSTRRSGKPSKPPGCRSRPSVSPSTPARSTAAPRAPGPITLPTSTDRARAGGACLAELGALGSARMLARRSRAAPFVTVTAIAGAMTIGGAFVGNSSPAPLGTEPAWAACAGPSGRVIYDRTHVRCRRARWVLNKVLHGNPTPARWFCNRSQKVCAKNRPGQIASSFRWRRH